MNGLTWTIGSMAVFLVLGIVAIQTNDNILAILSIIILMLSPVFGSGERQRLVEKDSAK